MPKFHQEKCEVCGEPVFSVASLPKELQDKVYRPGVDESYNVEIDLNKSQVFGPDEE